MPTRLNFQTNPFSLSSNSLQTPSNFQTSTILDMKMLLASILTLGSASLVAGVPLAAAAPQGLKVVGASVLGSGCPYGTADVHADPSNTAFEIRLSDYVVKTGPGTMASDWRKNCKLTLNLQYDAGFQYVHPCAKTGRPTFKADSVFHPGSPPSTPK
jgi:hypothetical protein